MTPRVASLLLLALWCVAVVGAFALIAGCDRDPLPVAGDMAARDASCGDLPMSLCENDLDCTCGRVCLHAGCGIPGRCIDSTTFDGGACGDTLQRCCNYPDEPHTFICRDGAMCAAGVCKGCP